MKPSLKVATGRKTRPPSPDERNCRPVAGSLRVRGPAGTRRTNWPKRNQGVRREPVSQVARCRRSRPPGRAGTVVRSALLRQHRRSALPAWPKASSETQVRLVREDSQPAGQQRSTLTGSASHRSVTAISVTHPVATSHPWREQQPKCVQGVALRSRPSPSTLPAFLTKYCLTRFVTGSSDSRRPGSRWRPTGRTCRVSTGRGP